MPLMGEQFADLYAEHLPAARRTALALVPADAAEDVVAEAFTRVLARQRAGGGPDGAFRPYLLAAVRNIARDWLAERGRCAPAPADPRAHRVPGAGELVTAAEEQAMTRRAFVSLPARWRAVLWQTEVEERTPAELARDSGMTPNAVAQLAVRARVGLAVAWQRERGAQERVTGPVPALARPAKGKHRKTLDTSQADRLLCSYSAGGAVRTAPKGAVKAVPRRTTTTDLGTEPCIAIALRCVKIATWRPRGLGSELTRQPCPSAYN
jgi:RNA polymerase sigma factor (sigma-70 family)